MDNQEKDEQQQQVDKPPHREGKSAGTQNPPPPHPLNSNSPPLLGFLALERNVLGLKRGGRGHPVLQLVAQEDGEKRDWSILLLSHGNSSSSASCTGNDGPNDGNIEYTTGTRPVAGQLVSERDFLVGGHPERRARKSELAPIGKRGGR